METPLSPSTVYRDHDIVVNPSGNADDALLDVFMILEPGANPMFTPVLHEHTRDKAQAYPSAEQACAAAMTQARAWIDAHLDGRKALADGQAG